jgi:hypothetical protein
MAQDHASAALGAALSKYGARLRLVVGVDFSINGNRWMDEKEHRFASLHDEAPNVYEQWLGAFGRAFAPLEPEIHALGWGGQFPDGSGGKTRAECWPMVGTDEKHRVQDAAALANAYRETVAASSLSFPNSMRPTLEYIGDTSCGDLEIDDNRERWEEQGRPFTVGLLLTGGPLEDLDRAKDGVHGLSEYAGRALYIKWTLHPSSRRTGTTSPPRPSACSSAQRGRRGSRNSAGCPKSAC